MMDSFKNLLARVRNGEADAAEQLLKNYESELKIVIRSRMRDSKLRRFADSIDICQSIMGNFFVRAANGQFELETPEDLVKLLATMARNKVHDLARRETSKKRDSGRVEPTPADEMAIPLNSESPSQVVASKELLAKAKGMMSSEVSEIRNLRSAGLSWEEISRKLGGTPESQRKRFAREMNRLCQDLGLLNEDYDA